MPIPDPMLFKNRPPAWHVRFISSIGTHIVSYIVYTQYTSCIIFITIYALPYIEHVNVSFYTFFFIPKRLGLCVKFKTQINRKFIAGTLFNPSYISSEPWMILHKSRRHYFIIINVSSWPKKCLIKHAHLFTKNWQNMHWNMHKICALEI